MKRLGLCAVLAYVLSACSAGGGSGISSGSLLPPTTSNGGVAGSATGTRQTIYLGGLIYTSSAQYVTQFREFSTGQATTGVGTVEPANTFTDNSYGIDRFAVDALGTLYAASMPATTTPGPRNEIIAEYAPGTSGNVTPARIILNDGSWSDTISMAVGADGTLYTLAFQPGCNAPNEILAFAAGASGAAHPVRVITGSNTGLGFGEIAVDAAGNIYFARDQSNGSAVLKFAPGASGNVAPVSTLAGNNTMLNEPSSIAITPSNMLAIWNYGSQTLTEYPLDASGNTKPVNSFTSPGSGGQAALMAVDAAGNYWLYMAIPIAPGDYSYKLVDFPPNASGNVNFAQQIDLSPGYFSAQDLAIR